MRTLYTVVPYKEKRDPDGKFLKCACRFTAADVNDGASLVDTFSTTVDNGTIKLLMALSLRMTGEDGEPIEGFVESDDVAGAYYQGEKPPEDIVFLIVPPGLEEFGHPAVDPATGARRYWRVKRNMPGLRYAGRVWEEHYTNWLQAQGFEQSIVDRRLFFRRVGKRLLIVAVLVDDSLFVSNSKPELIAFRAVWRATFP